MAPPPLWNRVVSRLYNCRADSETFAQVKINFREMFKELFGEKGEADLNLIDDSDPLESDIEITAKPPGKKLQSITLLSGGERSMSLILTASSKCSTASSTTRNSSPP